MRPERWLPLGLLLILLLFLVSCKGPQGAAGLLGPAGSRGPEPPSHTHSSWIVLHGQTIDNSCATCHEPEDATIDYTELEGKPPSEAHFVVTQPVMPMSGAMRVLTTPHYNRY